MAKNEDNEAIIEILDKTRPLRHSIISRFPSLELDEYDQRLSIFTIECIKEYDKSSNFFYYLKNRYNWFILDELKSPRDLPLPEDINETLESSEDIEGEYILKIEKTKYKKIIDDALNILNRREKDIIKKYYFDEKLIKEIAFEMELSQSTISRELKNSLKKMKRYIKKKYKIKDIE